MSDVFNIGLSALIGSQRALSTVSQNIANANTDGYSRQIVQFTAQTPQILGDIALGKGVTIAAVKRLASDFLNNQVRVSNTNLNTTSAQYDYASQLNNLLGDPSAGLSPALSDFFNSFQALSTDPAATTQRQAVLGNAQTLVGRFQDMANQLDQITTGINGRIQSLVTDINTAAKSIASLNHDISLLQGQGATPNDLLDKRDALIKDLSAKVGVAVVPQNDGTVNVSIGNGISLVAGSFAATLTTLQNPLDSSKTEVGYVTSAGTATISSSLNNGEIGGILQFRDGLLASSRNEIGKLAIGLAEGFNAQHAQGMDLTGALGGNFFASAPPIVSGLATNTGTLGAAFNPTASGALVASDYQVTYNGTNYVLTRLSDNSTQTLAGGGPFNVDGLTLTPGTAPAAGDSWLIQPYRTTARQLAVVVADPRNIAAASPVTSQASTANVGSATVSAPTITNIANASLLNTVTIAFNNPPTTYSVNGAGAFAYTSGGTISVNGWSVQVTGTPVAGDTFTVQANLGGTGDGTNALALANLQSSTFLNNGTTTLHEDYAAMVGQIGNSTSAANTSLSALKSVSDATVAARESVSGVNLDEEAADMVRFQQAYSAAAQIISTANQAFSTLIAALKG